MPKCPECKGTGWVKSIKRSLAQNRSLFKWYKEKADQCQAHGITMQMVLAATIDLEVNKDFIRDMYKRVLAATYFMQSTTEMTKTGNELNDTLDHINRFFMKKPFFLEGLPLPSRCQNGCQSIDCVCN